MHTVRNSAILIASMIFLLIAIGLEHPFFHIVDTSQGHSAIFNRETLISVARELAFALFIAWIIIITIETQSRKAEHEAHDILRKEIVQDVFKGVFARNLPNDYVDTVISAALYPNFIREYLNISYTIESIDPRKLDDIDGRHDGYIVLSRRIAWRFKNVSGRFVEEVVEFYMPKLTIAGENNRITKFKTGHDNSHMKDTMAQLVQSSNERGILYTWKVGLNSEQSIECVIEDRQSKRIAANEIISSNYPVLRTDITLDVRVRELKIGVNGRTATPLIEVHRADDGSSGRWGISGPTLPNDSITLWWN